jgi:hypothetical protein
LITKHFLLSFTISKHTPTKPSPIKVKTREAFTLFQIDKMPPLLPNAGRHAQPQSFEPHRLDTKESENDSILVS